MAIVELIGLLLCGLGFWDSATLELPPKLKVGGIWQFLTNCGVFTTTIFIIVDFLFKKNTTNFYHLVANIECCITFSYWSTFFLYPDSLNGDSFEYDLWLDLRTHLIPYIYLLCFVDKPRSSFKTSLLLSIFGLGTYWIYISVLMYKHCDLAYVPYPMLASKIWWQRLFYLLKLITLSQINYILQGLKHKIINHYKSKELKSS